MGQSVSLGALSAASAGINVRELEDLTYEKSLGTARFMKCIRARHQNGLVVVKVAMRPYPDFKMGEYIKAIRRERDILADVPNALGYQRVLETESSGYLLRQYLHSSLYDRMSTRPFLEDIEKKWLAFQLLCALRDCHSRNVYHGDIKTENILVTSWNWVYLTDFSSSFKKTYLPEDNPADFSYFFDTSGKRTCYLAPERFLGAGDEGDSRGVTWAMDVFSAGCVIAELFLESPIFTLSQLFKYRKGDFDPKLGALSKIEDNDIRELVTHMIQVEPESRYSAEEYLNFWRRKAFPEYFYSFLHQYMGLITDPSSGRAPVEPETANFGEADDRIDRVYFDFDKISYFLGFDNNKDNQGVPELSSAASGEVLPVEIDIPNNRHAATSAGRKPVDDGTLIFLTLVVSALRNTARSSSRLRACDLMLAFGERITDEAKLDRILPYVVVLLTDRADIVKIAAIRTITQLLSLVTVVSPVNGYVFTEYIKPRLQNMVEDSGSKIKPIVRAAYASCLGSLAHTSLRILDMVQALRADGSIPTIDPEAEVGVATNAMYQNLYDVAKSDLVAHFESHTKALLTDSDASVRRALLGSVSSLCVFFGTPLANDVVLSHLNTYLNDKDWMLKCAFFQTIVGVATFVGGPSLEDFILPLMVQALTDPEEFVVERVLSSFAVMSDLGLFQRSKTWEMVDVVARFMVHPNIWIREAAVHFVSSSTHFLSSADTHCIILPLIQPYLKSSIVDFSETTILDALRRPVSRPVLEMAITWATKVDRGLFWKPAQQQRTFSFGGPDQTVATISSKDLGTTSLRKIPKNEKDEQWLARLKNLGMTADDDFKLLALREYIYRFAFNRPKDTLAPITRLNSVMHLKEFNVTPQTVFFETRKKQKTVSRRFSHDGTTTTGIRKTPHTIADALLDASTTMNGPHTLREKSQAGIRIPQKSGGPAAHPLPAGFNESRRTSSNVPSPLSSSPGTRNITRDHLMPSTAPPTRASSRVPTRLSSAEDARSDGTSTPTESMKRGSGRDQINGLRPKGSAINLLNHKITPKTLAQTSTDDTYATGEMDVPLNANTGDDASSALNGHVERGPSPLASLRAAHTYSGGDPNVMRLLDDLASENYPIDLVDFGPQVVPVGRRLKKTDTQEADIPWRPRGIHVATFGEHTGAINRVLPSPDHAFFITASNDGSVKVWDTSRLERNLIHRSRQTHHHAENAKVLTISFVENTHTFVSCADDGSIHVVKVDCTPIGDTAKYGKLRLVREYQLPEGEWAVWSEHFRYDAKSVLILATNKSHVLAIDLRAMTHMYDFSIPPQHGTPTCFVVDTKRNWLLIGTTLGILDLWDLRFHLRVISWDLQGRSPIHRLSIHPFKSRSRWVCVAGGTSPNEISIWDIEKMQCREVFRAGGSDENLKAYEVHQIDNEKPTSMLDRFTTALEPPRSGNMDFGIRALAVGIDTPSDDRTAKYGYFLTGGADRKLRFWDLAKVELSAVVSGLEVDEPQPKYLPTHPTTTLTVNVERAAQSGPSAPNAGTGGSSRAEAGDKAKSNSGAKRAGGSTANKQPRSAVIAAQQKGLLRRHLDVITDVAVLERPVGMTVSVDRRGCVYVFQ
ncbi:Serine/threonine-protein kinase [Lambiella insularis]|nr:Serine/threonine-protein kinase [Lambiella insularis]